MFHFRIAQTVVFGTAASSAICSSTIPSTTAASSFTSSSVISGSTLIASPAASDLNFSSSETVAQNCPTSLSDRCCGRGKKAGCKDESSVQAETSSEFAFQKRWSENRRTERDRDSWCRLPISRRYVFFRFPLAALARFYSDLHLRICETKTRKNFFREMSVSPQSISLGLTQEIDRAIMTCLPRSSVSFEPLVAK